MRRSCVAHWRTSCGPTRTSLPWLLSVGHDLLFDTLTGIEAGNIDATLGQNPYAQAYLPIMYAYQRVVIGTPKVDLPDGNWFTGTEIVNKDNVAQFITREKRFQSS